VAGSTALLVLLLASALATLALLALVLWGQRARGATDPELERRLRDDLRVLREEHAAQQRALREELAARLAELAQGHQAAHDRLRDALAAQFSDLRAVNERKLEEVRLTVDEKLHGVLEQRLGESVPLVSQRLEAVQRGLGEMQALATGVGDLKRVLSNVKARGVIGEVQLRALLEEILTPEQFTANWAPDDDTRDVVEFAIRLPGRDADATPVFLPVDAKFPVEDYLRLCDAQERGELAALPELSAALARTARTMARDIRDKYLRPPRTTDFAILFLPTEGLYAEVLRQPGLADELRRTFSVVVAGPTTLTAFVTSLRMGFRTLAIERRSSEVWQVLSAVKSEFGRFGEVLDRVKRQLLTAQRTIDETGRRTRAMERHLREVEELPAERRVELPGVEGDASAPGGALELGPIAPAQ
jgi:DNA recombination protein RmuC